MLFTDVTTELASLFLDGVTRSRVARKIPGRTAVLFIRILDFGGNRKLLNGYNPWVKCVSSINTSIYFNGGNYIKKKKVELQWMKVKFVE